MLKKGNSISGQYMQLAERYRKLVFKIKSNLILQKRTIVWFYDTL